MFQHSDFANEELYVVAKYCGVLTEGSCSYFFMENTELIEGLEDNIPVVDEGLDSMKLVPNLIGNLIGNIARLTLDGFEVDDDNELSEENNAAPTQTKANLYEVQFQERDSKQSRKSDGHREENPRLSKTPEALTRTGFFILFLHTKYIKGIITNDIL